MRRIWFRLSLWALITAAALGSILAIPDRLPVLAQELTPAATSGGPTITAGIDGVRVRMGPSGNDLAYPEIGFLQPGETAQAIGVSLSHDWIQIVFPAGPGGVGWVYAAYVELSPGFLRVIEPPPTATRPASPTIDPTFAAQFNLKPTATRLPTFTPPPPLVVPTFADPAPEQARFPYGGLIAGIILIGLLGLVFSMVARR
jgi:uncharacterized protein YraI